MKQSIGQRLKKLVGDVEVEEITNHMMIDILAERINNLKQQLNNEKAHVAHYQERLESIIEHNKMTRNYLNYHNQYFSGAEITNLLSVLTSAKANFLLICWGKETKRFIIPCQYLQRSSIKIKYSYKKIAIILLLLSL